MSIVGSGGAGDFLSAAITGITGYPFSFTYHVLVPSTSSIGASGMGVFMLDSSASPDGSDIKSIIRPGTTAGKLEHRTTRDENGSGAANEDDDDVFDDDTWVNVTIVVNSATSCQLYIAGSLVSTKTASRDVVDQTLDTLYLIGKGIAVNDFKTAEVAVWRTTALSGTNATDLTTKTPDNIGSNPDYYWSLFDNINADIGGVNLTDGGTSSYTQDSGDHPSLTGPSAGLTTILKGGSNIVLNSSGDIVGV